MKKELLIKNLSIGVFIFLISSGYTFAINVNPLYERISINRDNWLYVGGSGPNNYTMIQDAIDNASLGNTVFVFNGTYIGHININKSINLIGENKYTTFITGFLAYTISIISDWVNMSGFTIQNGKHLGEGVRIDSSYNNFNNNILNTPNDDLRIFGENNTISDNTIICEITYLSGDNNTILGNTITNKDYGIYLIDTIGNIISNNSFFESGLFFSGNNIWDNVVTNNAVNDKPLVYVYNESDLLLEVDAGQIIIVNCTNITIKNQEIFNTTVGIQILGSNNCIISGNNITGNKYGICLFGWNNTLTENIIIKNYDAVHLSGDCNTISSNFISNNNDGIYLDYSTNYNNIINNTITNNYNSLSLDYGSDFNYILNNTITNNVDAIYISSNSNIISDNTIKLNSKSINLVSSTNIISSNTITDNVYGLILYLENNNVYDNFITNNDYGIVLNSNSNHNNIINNTITDNDYGLMLDYSSNCNNIFNNTFTKNNCGIKCKGDYENNVIKNIIFGNIISNNYYGINIDANSSNNTIYRNNFINNTINALDDGKNIWDEGKKGNYWDDYKEKYPKAHRLWREGIWDKPYEIQGYGYNKDNFPLIKPFNNPKNKVVYKQLQNILEHYLYLFLILKKILNILW